MTAIQLTAATDAQIHAAIERLDNEIAEAEEAREKLIVERRRRYSARVAADVQAAIRHAFTGGREGKPFPNASGASLLDAAREMSWNADYAARSNAIVNERHMSRSHDAALSRAANGSY